MHTNDDHEREVKFFIADLKEMFSRLSVAGAVKQKERVREYNLRFDTPHQSLRSQHQVLRLRQDDQTHLTFKGQTDLSQGIADRRELEITVSDFNSARKILEGLGFVVFLIYEKFRTTYQLNACEIVLDELPFGYFMEIEGETAQVIQTVAQKLNLDWEKRITLSYLELFNNLKTNKNLHMENIVFESFQNRKFIESDFFIEPVASP
jgi:adenylate cyclase class 2